MHFDDAFESGSAPAELRLCVIHIKSAPIQQRTVGQVINGVSVKVESPEEIRAEGVRATPAPDGGYRQE